MCFNHIIMNHNSLFKLPFAVNTWIKASRNVLQVNIYPRCAMWCPLMCWQDSNWWQCPQQKNNECYWMNVIEWILILWNVSNCIEKLLFLLSISTTQKGRGNRLKLCRQKRRYFPAGLLSVSFFSSSCVLHPVEHHSQHVSPSLMISHSVFSCWRS